MSADQTFIFASDEVVKFDFRFKQIKQDQYTPSLLQVKLEDLTSRYEIMVAAYERLMMDEETKYEKGFKEAASSKCETATDDYHNCKANILDI